MAFDDADKAKETYRAIPNSKKQGVLSILVLLSDSTALNV